MIEGSAWLLARGGSGNPLAGGGAPGGSLGGSQAGFRLYAPLSRPLSFTVQANAALAPAGAREVAVGLALRDRNFGLIVERRVALNSAGRNATALTGFAGIDRVALPHRFRLDGYAQAGFVDGDAFADASVRVEREILTVGRSSLSVGAGIWAGIQPEVARLDVGPQIVARVPLHRPTRISVEWRQRVAGQAAPASGPSLTLATDF